MKERIVDEQIRLIPYYQNDAFGHVIGSEECEEGKIFIEPQGMCVMAGIFSLIHISEATRRAPISYAVFCL